MPRRYGYPRIEAPDATTVQGVPYISMYNPQDYEDYSKILQNAQQRYDVAQAAIAQSLKDYAEAEVSREYQPRLQEIVDAKYQDLNKIIQDKYNGDYGNAANEIVNQLALIRKPIVGAVQASKVREEARKLYQQGVMTDNINSVLEYNKDTGKVERRRLDFDEIVGKQDIFDESGRFIGIPDYTGKFRGASNLSKYIEENISKYMNDEMKQTGLKKHPGVFGYLIQETTKGRSDTDIMNDFIDSETGTINQNGVALARQLRNEAKFFGDEAKNLTDEQVVNYALPIIQGQVREQKLINPEFDRWAAELRSIARKKQQQPPQTIPYSYRTVVDTSKSTEDVQKQFQDINKVRSGKMLGQQGSGVSGQIPYNGFKVPQFGAPKGMDVDENAKNKMADIEKKYSKKLKEFGNDKDSFYKWAEQQEISRTKSKYLLGQHSDIVAQDVFTNAMNSTISKGINDKFNILDEGLNKKDEIKGKGLFNEGKGKIVNSEIDLYNGRIIGYTNEGKTIEMNKNLLSDRQEKLLNLASKVIQNVYDETDESYKPVIYDKQKQIIGAPEGYSGYPVYMKGDDGLIHMTYVDRNGKPWTINKQPIDIKMSEEMFRKDVMDDIYTDVNPGLRENKKPASISGQDYENEIDE